MHSAVLAIVSDSAMPFCAILGVNMMQLQNKTINSGVGHFTYTVGDLQVIVQFSSDPTCSPDRRWLYLSHGEIACDPEDAVSPPEQLIVKSCSLLTNIKSVAGLTPPTFYQDALLTGCSWC